MFEFKNGELREVEMPDWLDIALVDDVVAGLKSLGYVADSLYGEEFGFGVHIFERDMDKPFPWIASIDTSSHWHLVLLETFPEYMAFLHYISPIATANLLSWFFRSDFDILEVFETVKNRFNLYHSKSR